MTRETPLAPFARKAAPVAKVLPAPARNALVAASQIEGEEVESVRRIAAIDRATKAAKFIHPSFFKEQ